MENDDGASSSSSFAVAGLDSCRSSECTSTSKPEPEAINSSISSHKKGLPTIRILETTSIVLMMLAKNLMQRCNGRMDLPVAIVCRIRWTDD